MTTANKPATTDAPAGQTGKEDIAKKGPIIDDEMVDAILSSEEDTPSPSPKDGQEKPEEKPKPEAGKDKPEDKPKPDAKPEVAQDPYLKIGAQEFKTKEEVIAFVNSQKGYNSWITGVAKKVHPEWFNSDGSIKTKDLDKLIKEAGKATDKAAATIEKHADKPEEELTPEQKAEVDKAKGVLRKLGFISVDSDEFKSLKQTVEELRSERDQSRIADAQEKVTMFETAHPTAVPHREGLAALIQSRGYNDLEKAWSVYKIENGVEEAPIKKPEGSSPETTVPTTVPKASGSKPDKGGEKDLMDEIMDVKGI